MEVFPPLSWALGFNDIDVANALLDAKADVNWQNPKNGITLLHLIVARKKILPEMMERLLNAGADPNKCDKQGKSALDKCVNDSVKKVLLRHGAKSGRELIRK